MVWGFFMKMVIADRVALLIDTVFDNYRMYGSTELIIAAIGFTIQIYWILEVIQVLLLVLLK